MTDPDTTGILCQILPFKALPTQDHMKDIDTYWYTLSNLTSQHLACKGSHERSRYLLDLGTMTDPNTYWYSLENLTFQGIVYTGSCERYRHLSVHFIQSYLPTPCLHRITRQVQAPLGTLCPILPFPAAFMDYQFYSVVYRPAKDCKSQ